MTLNSHDLIGKKAKILPMKYPDKEGSRWDLEPLGRQVGHCQ